MTTTEQFREDAEWLREQAESLLARVAGEVDKSEREDATRLQHIANSLDIAATVMFTPSLVLEKRAEELVAKEVEHFIDNKQGTSTILLWLIYQALKSGANKALLGQGLAGLGMGAAASLFKGIGKQPLDSEDK